MKAKCDKKHDLQSPLRSTCDWHIPICEITCSTPIKWWGGICDILWPNRSQMAIQTPYKNHIPGKKNKWYTMLFRIEIIHLNIFKNCGAVELILELGFYLYTCLPPPGWHITAHERIQLLKKLYRYIIMYYSSNFRIIPGAKSVLHWSGNWKNRYVGKKLRHCDR
jgi:hypothetical protein